jgi:hypothetical protein
MSRVGKAGYIETPSPICELARGVDGSSPPYRGYHHHRFIVWSSKEGTLDFVTKYPLIEYIGNEDDSQYASLLRQGPKYWNTYHLWEGELRTRHWQSPIDFNVGVEYRKILRHAAAHSMSSSDDFWEYNLCRPPFGSVIASLPQRHAAV